MRTDIMVDIETLGTNPDSTIIQISAMAFDIRTGEKLGHFNRIADISKNEKMNVTGDTIKWWLRTNKELLTELIEGGSDSSEDTLRKFNKWLRSFGSSENLYLWGNGILFDNAMIQAQMRAVGLRYPVFFRNDRDVRTIVELASQKLGITEKELKQRYEDPTLVHHNAFDDVRYQINLVCGCYNVLMDRMESHAV